MINHRSLPPYSHPTFCKVPQVSLCEVNRNLFSLDLNLPPFHDFTQRLWLRRPDTGTPLLRPGHPSPGPRTVRPRHPELVGRGSHDPESCGVDRQTRNGSSNVRPSDDPRNGSTHQTEVDRRHFSVPGQPTLTNARRRDLPPQDTRPRTRD